MKASMSMIRMTLIVSGASVLLAAPSFAAGGRETIRDRMKQRAGEEISRSPVETATTSSASETTASLGIFQSADTNGDGELTKEEFVAFAEKQFVDNDANGDGRLQAGEVKKMTQSLAPAAMGGAVGAGGLAGRLRERLGAGGGGGQDMSGMLFSRADRNGDGKLSSDELPEKLKGRLSQLDRDGDGAISKDEMSAITDRLRQGQTGAAGRGKGRR